jgi:hypothetical protein
MLFDFPILIDPEKLHRNESLHRARSLQVYFVVAVPKLAATVGRKHGADTLVGDEFVV